MRIFVVCADFEKKTCKRVKQITAIWEMTISDIFLCLLCQ